jgi:hypothetical protein
MPEVAVPAGAAARQPEPEAGVRNAAFSSLKTSDLG